MRIFLGLVPKESLCITVACGGQYCLFKGQNELHTHQWRSDCGSLLRPKKGTLITYQVQWSALTIV